MPEEVLELANLRTLEIMYNHLQTLPPELGNKLGRLKNLDVSHNKLTKLPPSIAKYAHVLCVCVCVPCVVRVVR